LHVTISTEPWLAAHLVATSCTCMTQGKQAHWLACAGSVKMMMTGHQDRRNQDTALQLAALNK
jgi:hypothetical protein